MNNKKILGNIAQVVNDPVNYKFDKIKNKNTKLNEKPEIIFLNKSINLILEKFSKITNQRKAIAIGKKRYKK